MTGKTHSSEIGSVCKVCHKSPYNVDIRRGIDISISVGMFRNAYKGGFQLKTTHVGELKGEGWFL